MYRLYLILGLKIQIINWLYCAKLELLWLQIILYSEFKFSRKQIHTDDTYLLKCYKSQAILLKCITWKLVTMKSIILFALLGLVCTSVLDQPKGECTLFIFLFIYTYNVCHGRGSRREPRTCKFCYLFNIKEGLGFVILADIVLILINP